MNILVVGRAKTGTTVISKTIQNSLGEGCEYWLEPKNLSLFFDPASFDVEKNHVVKIIFEHWDNTPRLRNGLFFNESPVRFDKIISIIRDPRDELVSRLMYLLKPWMDAHGRNDHKNKQWISALREKEANPDSISFMQMVRAFDEIYDTHMLQQIGHLRAFSNYYDNVEHLGDRTHVLKYEDFMQGNLHDLESYLGFKLSNSRDVGALARTRRTASFNNWKTFFTADDVRELQPLYSSLLQRLGYNDWELSEQTSLPAANYSDYVIRLESEHAA